MPRPARLYRWPMAVVTFDAFDTLIALEPPVPRLTAALARVGHPQPAGAVAAALTREIRFYLEHHMRGSDPAALAALRRDAAAVLAEALDDPPPLDMLTEIMVASLRFRLFADTAVALDLLRSRGVRLAVVSNWDCSIGEVLTGLGVANRFEVIVSSAVVGVAKPGAEPFHAALEQMGVTPSPEVFHCGDQVAVDGHGARAAGLTPVIVERERATAGDAEAAGYRRVRRLTELADLVA